MPSSPLVLYIDDDPGIGRLVQKTLAAHGMTVEIASSGADGIARLQETAFDIVALDHHMPGQTGLQILPLIRELPAAPPVVYVTGSEDSHIAVAAMKAGAADYVWKDVQGHFRELLAEALKTSLDKERLRREKQAAVAEMLVAKERAELLLKEVNHRVANSLAIVASLVSLQRNRFDDPQMRDMLDQMRARIIAIAAIHRRLYTSEDVTSVDLKDYLQNLITELAQSQASANLAASIRFDCPPISLPTDKAVSFGVIVTELLTNAIKYAYPDGRRGEVRIRITASGGEGVLTVEDDGVGLSGGKPAGTGLGSRIVTMMAANLGGSIEIENAHPGVRACMTFSLT